MKRVLLGMLTPSSNTVLEPVTADMLREVPEASAHFGRFAVTRIALSEGALAQFDTPGVLGARMTGGGFGGCVVAVFAPDRRGAIDDALAAFWQRQGTPPQRTISARPSGGAQLINLNLEQEQP